MASYDFEHAKAFFKAKVGFTAGLHEVDGMIKQGEDIVIVDVRLPSDFKRAHLPGAINLPDASGIRLQASAATRLTWCIATRRPATWPRWSFSLRAIR